MKKRMMTWCGILMVAVLLCGCMESLTDVSSTPTQTPIVRKAKKKSAKSAKTKKKATKKAIKKQTKLAKPTKVPVVVNKKIISKFAGKAYKVVNNNKPRFTKKQKISTKAFEKYSSLDRLGRCGVAFANICKQLMPTEKRGAIGQVRPSGWHTVKYDNVDGKYLYNRCHLIGFQLAGENANERNLITGTRYMNIEGMLPFENEVDDYVDSTGNHVLYRVTPLYKGDNLVASGVQMEAYSVEDKGTGVCFNIYAYNAQPGVKIDYRSGESSSKGNEQSEPKATSSQKKSRVPVKACKYVVNTNTKKFHSPSCPSATETLPKNRWYFKGKRKDLMNQGYVPCKRCNP